MDPDARPGVLRRSAISGLSLHDRRHGADARRVLPGGVVFYGGDPGVGILLLPIGAVLLLVAVALTLRGTRVAG